MQYILWNFPYLVCPDTSRRSVGSPVLGRWGRSGHSETGARFVRGRSERSSRPLFNRPRVHYTPAVVVWRRWEDGGEVEEQEEDLGALCRSTQQASKQASKSREAPRSGWHGKLRPGRSREQKPSRSDLDLQPRGQPPPSSRDGLAITIARHRLSVEQDN